MFNKIMISLLFVLVPISYADIVQPYPFDQYRSASVYQGKFHPLQNKQWRSHRTRIANAYQQKKIDFAGFYTFAGWGCGTSCYSGVMIDARTGFIYEVPYATEYPLNSCMQADGTVAEEETFQYRADSRLFIAVNCHFELLNEEEDIWQQNKTVYAYEWLEKQKKFRLLQDKIVDRKIFRGHPYS